MRRVLFWQYWHKRDYNRLGSALTPPSNSGVLMQIVLRGAAAGYEAEHTARIFYPAAELSQTLPDDTADLVLAVAHKYLLLVLVRQNGTTTWVQQRPPQGDARTQEYALCRMLYTMLCGVTGIRPPWGMMTGVRPVRIIHDLRAEGKTEEEIEQRFCSILTARRAVLPWPKVLRTCSARCWSTPSRWIAVCTRAFRSARPAAAIAALFPARWGINPAVRW